MKTELDEVIARLQRACTPRPPVTEIEMLDYFYDTRSSHVAVEKQDIQRILSELNAWRTNLDTDRVNWYNKNGSAIYMTAGGRFSPPQWAVRPRDANGHLIYDNYQSRLHPTFREAVDAARALEATVRKPTEPPNRNIREGVQPKKSIRRYPSWREQYFKVAKANKIARVHLAEAQRSLDVLTNTLTAMGLIPK